MRLFARCWLIQVETFAEKHAAEAATRLLKGVKAVAEEIEVRLAFDATRGRRHSGHRDRPPFVGYVRSPGRRLMRATQIPHWAALIFVIADLLAMFAGIAFLAGPGR